MVWRGAGVGGERGAVERRAVELKGCAVRVAGVSLRGVSCLLPRDDALRETRRCLLLPPPAAYVDV